MAPKLHPHPMQVNQAAERRMADECFIVLPFIEQHTETTFLRHTRWNISSARRQKVSSTHVQIRMLSNIGMQW